MKNRKRTPALLLALALTASLCACSGLTSDPTTGTANPDPSLNPASSPNPSAAPSIEVDREQDAIAFAAGLSGDDILLTANGEDVPADLFLYWLFLNSYYFEYTYYYYGITVADVADNLLEDTVDTAVYYTVMREKAAQLGCLPTDAQVKEARDNVLAEGQAYYDSLKAAYGLSDRSFDYISTVSCYYENLLDAMFPTATEEMLNGYVYQVRHILLSTVDNATGAALDEETVAAQRALAEDILAQLQAVEGEELEKLFDELMNQYSEDGRDGNGNLYAPDGYTTIPGKMVPEFEEASLALPIGGLSGIVESNYGYHIILRGEVDDFEEYIDGCREYYLDKEMEALMETAEVTRSDALAGIDVPGFYERYIAYQNAVMEQYRKEEAG